MDRFQSAWPKNGPVVQSLTALHAVFLFVFFLTPLCPGADVFSDPVIAEVARLHDVAIDGKMEDVERAEAKMEKVLEADPKNALVKAYHGSLLTIKSGKAFPGPAKLDFLKEGLRTMDAAVSAAPKDPAVRFVRAINNYMLPGFVNRKDNAREDFKMLLVQISDTSAAGRLDEQTKQAIYYYAGLAFKKSKAREEAKSAWEKGLTLGSSTALGLKIGKELSKINKGPVQSG